MKRNTENNKKRKKKIEIYEEVIEKLLNDFIEIKPMPKGKIKDRIIVTPAPLTLIGNKLIFENSEFIVFNKRKKNL